MQKLTQGILLAIEGIDGSGKSTLAKNLAAALQAQGFKVLLTKEPGGTALGKRLRHTLQEKDVPVDARAEYLLFAADRAQHFKELIIPALATDTIVISDRMADSSLVYQGYGRGLNLAMLKTINQWSMHNIQPTRTIYVKVPLEISFERLKQRQSIPTSFEKESKEFMQTLLRGFDELYKDRHDVLILDGQLAPEAVCQTAVALILDLLNRLP